MKPESAFPQIQTQQPNENKGESFEVYSEGGMTLRDYFAAKAMQGFCSLTEDGSSEPMMGAADTAKAAYNYADAMLAEREKQK